MVNENQGGGPFFFIWQLSTSVRDFLGCMYVLLLNRRRLIVSIEKPAPGPIFFSNGSHKFFLLSFPSAAQPQSKQCFTAETQSTYCSPEYIFFEQKLFAPCLSAAGVNSLLDRYNQNNHWEIRATAKALTIAVREFCGIQKEGRGQRPPLRSDLTSQLRLPAAA